MNHHPGGRLQSRRVLLAAARYFGIVFGVGLLLGAVRVPFLVPHLGERVAELAEMPLMFIAIFLVAGHVVRKYGASVAPLGWVWVGALSLAFLVTAKLLLRLYWRVAASVSPSPVETRSLAPCTGCCQERCRIFSFDFVLVSAFSDGWIYPD